MRYPVIKSTLARYNAYNIDNISYSKNIQIIRGAFATGIWYRLNMVN